ALLQAESQARSARQVVPWTNDTTQSAISAAEAQLADATAEHERARLSYEQASSSELAFAEANVHSKEAANDRAQADLARMKPLRPIASRCRSARRMRERRRPRSRRPARISRRPSCNSVTRRLPRPSTGWSRVRASRWGRSWRPVRGSWQSFRCTMSG